MPFAKGQSGNPKGRPAKLVEDAQQSVLNQVFDAAAERRVLLAQIKIACDPQARNATAAAKFLFERKYGPVVAQEPEQKELTIKVVYVDEYNPNADESDD